MTDQPQPPAWWEHPRVVEEYNIDEDGNTYGGDHVLLGIGGAVTDGEPDVWIEIGGFELADVQAVRQLVINALREWPT